MTATLASAHNLSLPHPAPSALAAAMAKRVQPDEQARVTVTHVLYAQCRCSQRIVDHLVSRRARRDVSESVLLAGTGAALASRLRVAGYRVEEVQPLALRRRYAIESAPLLIVADASHVLRYVGGYTAHKQALAIHDTRTIDRVLRGEPTVELPLLGCAVSRRLRALLDPFRLQFLQQGDDVQ